MLVQLNNNDNNYTSNNKSVIQSVHIYKGGLHI